MKTWVKRTATLGTALASLAVLVSGCGESPAGLCPIGQKVDVVAVQHDYDNNYEIEYVAQDGTLQWYGYGTSSVFNIIPQAGLKHAFAIRVHDLNDGIGDMMDVYNVYVPVNMPITAGMVRAGKTLHQADMTYQQGSGN